MQHNIIIVILWVFAWLPALHSQSTIAAVLTSVEQKNKTLASGRQLLDAQKLAFKTGLTLPNPTVQGQYLFGSPSTAGNQTDVFIVQPFDFPTTYKKRKAMAAAKGSAATTEFYALRREILLQTHTVCLEIIYRNQLQRHYRERQLVLEALLQDFQKRLQSGDIGILDINKVKLQLLELQQSLSKNQLETQKLNGQLQELNGGEKWIIQDTIYPPMEQPGNAGLLDTLMAVSDPIQQNLEQQMLIANQELALSKAWRLPTFEAGYHYQGILGQQFNGLHLGMVLPVWEHRYRVQAQQAQIAYVSRQLEARQSSRQIEVQSLLERSQVMKTALLEYETALSQIKNVALLDKALQLGEISTSNYFLELSFYQNAQCNLLEAEWEYQQLLAEMNQYRL